MFSIIKNILVHMASDSQIIFQQYHSGSKKMNNFMAFLMNYLGTFEKGCMDLKMQRGV